MIGSSAEGEMRIATVPRPVIRFARGKMRLLKNSLSFSVPVFIVR